MELFTKIKETSIYSSFFEDGSIFLKTSTKISKKWICPLCGKIIMKGPIFLLFNNWKLFSNVVIHKECVDRYSTKEEAMMFLFEDYKEALKHKHWFNID